MSKIDDEMVLYVLMRTDMDSMNAGKGMAQAAHAGEVMRYHVNRAGNDWRKKYIEWLDQGGKFGTTIVLGAGWGTIAETLRIAQCHSYNVICGAVVDPTYPVRDGGVMHLIEIETCAFVFGTKAECAWLLTDYELHS